MDIYCVTSYTSKKARGYSPPAPHSGVPDIYAALLQFLNSSNIGDSRSPECIPCKTPAGDMPVALQMYIKINH